jgi:hypothetical protein
MYRRTFLTSIGSIPLAGLAGCSAESSESPPAGSLRFVNEHNVPHAIRMRVTGVGSTPGDTQGAVEGDPIVPAAQRELTTSTTVKPGHRQTYESVFTEPVWYGIEFTLDGEVPDDDVGVTTFQPAPADEETGRILSGKVFPSGEFSWVISSTENLGTFNQ